MRQSKVNGQVTVSNRKRRLGRVASISRGLTWSGRALLLALILLGLVWLGKQAYTFCLAWAIRTESAQMGVLVSDYTGQAIILRNESVIRAPFAGSVGRLIPEGTRVHIGTAVCRISGVIGPEKNQGPVELQSPVAGVVCYRLDGWEGILTPTNYKKMDLFALYKAVRKNTPDNTAPVVQSGDPVYKIIDNLVYPCLVIKFDSQPHDLAIDARVELQWGEGGQGKGKVELLTTKSGALIAVVEMNEANQDLFSSRMTDIKLINKKYEGIILPAKALVRTASVVGVYARTPVGFKFTKIQVLGVLGDRVALKGIPVGTDVVINPSLVKRIDQEI